MDGGHYGLTLENKDTKFGIFIKKIFNRLNQNFDEIFIAPYYPVLQACFPGPW